MKVYPHKWQGASRPIVATYENGQKVMWLLTCERGRVQATPSSSTGRRSTPDVYSMRAVVDQAVGLYGVDRLEKAFGQQILEEAFA